MANTDHADTATFEAGRLIDLGKHVNIFFSKTFQASRVTKGSDRGKIEQVLRNFIGERMRRFTFNRLAGWFEPQCLTTVEIEAVMRGQPMEFVSLDGFHDQEQWYAPIDGNNTNDGAFVIKFM